MSRPSGGSSASPDGAVRTARKCLCARLCRDFWLTPWRMTHVPEGDNGGRPTGDRWLLVSVRRPTSSALSAIELDQLSGRNAKGGSWEAGVRAHIPAFADRPWGRVVGLAAKSVNALPCLRHAQEPVAYALEAGSTSPPRPLTCRGRGEHRGGRPNAESRCLDGWLPLRRRGGAPATIRASEVADTTRLSPRSQTDECNDTSLATSSALQSAL
jgi:hypothetical protein